MKPRSLPLASLLSSRCRSTRCSAAFPSPVSSISSVASRQEQVGAQAVEDQALLLPFPRLLRLVPLVDEREQPAEGVVQVRALDGARAGQFDQGQVTEPVEPVALVVLLRADRQHLQLGRRLRVQQEEDPVQVPQRLPGERLRLLLRQRVESLGLPALDHLVGDDLDRQPYALAQVLGHAHGVLDGILEDAVPPDAALRVRREGFGAHAGQGTVDLAAALGVVPVADELQVDGQVTPLGPPGSLGYQQPAAR